ncbi:RHS repeat-associated core domain-containing protein [Chryseobacterium sp.]|uniref:RHS repeat domain-containing protein n=1 Tax=Chryseobacterium sp. TaxID=1871047 RepID=UPI0024E1A053|nr:RHS repeat-associated core domain-containing protein [Chryseobacterium sp.]
MNMKLFSSFILSLCSVMGFSQTILYQAESTTRTVQDPQTVVLAPGFTAKSNVSNPFVAKIGPATENPGGGPTDSQAGANNPNGTVPPEKTFHNTQGNIEVNGGGQLQFSLPIALPPGVKTVAPQINLLYTSGSSNGIAGYGWNITGTTAISRIGETIEKDGNVKKIQLNYSDFYSFNGQRLILKTGEYGKDGAEYTTEKYSNIKIKSIGAYSLKGQDIGPAQFEVTFEDGSQAWYGSYNPGSTGRADATTPTEYNIVKWKDINGNYISYNYESKSTTTGFRSLDTTVRISSIEWGGNETLNKRHFNIIEFNYINRDLIEQSYVLGLEYEQSKILAGIKVSSNGSLFKKYTVSYIKNGTNYQFLDKITESNPEGKDANPITFSYPDFKGPQIDSGFLSYNKDDFSNIRFTGDFNGDSYLDFIMNNGIVKLGAFNDVYSDIPTGKVFSGNSRVVNTLIDEEGQIHNGNGIIQYENGKVEGYVFRNNAFVKVFEKLVYDTSDCATYNPSYNCYIDAILNEGDINGDGISDALVSIRKTECYVDIIYDPSGQPSEDLKCYERRPENFIVDLKNANNPLSTYTLDSGINENSYTDQTYVDTNHDGKVDVINITPNTYTVFEFVKTAPYQYIKKIKFSGNLKEVRAPQSSVMFGDFNGDGNLDFTFPVTDNQDADNWRFYMGTETGFEAVLKNNFLKYRKPSDPTWSLIEHHYYSVSDVNKDGKSDITFIYSKTKSGQVGGNGNAQTRDLLYEIKTMQANGGTNFTPSETMTRKYWTQGGDYELFQPISIPFKSNNNYYDIFLFNKELVHKYKAQTGLPELSRIKSINQGGITTYIDYLEVIPDNTINSNFYKKNKKEYYPYFSLIRSDQSYAVSQLRQESRKQDFRYRGITGHMQGKGVIGYHQSARSSWYADGFENTKKWNGVEIDPLNEGMPIKEWSIRTNDESKIFPIDISENNSQLLSFKSTLYRTDQLINGQVVNSVSDTDKPKIVKALVPISTLSKDFLTGNLVKSTITYGDYYLPTQSVSNVNNGYATTTSTFEYIHNASGIGTDYYIGRPKSKTDIVQAYGDTKSAKEEYTYENNLLKTLKNWNRDNTGYLFDTYEYDNFGNIIQKTIGNSIDSQTQTAKTDYDATGRFVIKKTDNLGLVTHIEYNDWGQIKKQTDPLGNILENNYDSWGKLLTSKTNLGGTTTYEYAKDDNFNISVTQYDPDGNISKKYTNKLGQEYKNVTKAFNQNKYIAVYSVYDKLGRKIRDSEPYFEVNDTVYPNDIQWNFNIYDDNVYPAKVTSKGLAKIKSDGSILSFIGKEIESSVLGNTVSVKESNGYERLSTKTTDALGNVITSTDKGGSIQFSYNAAGEQVKAQYAENIVTTEYDAWGRKSKFNDPSNGLYQYEYNSFGQPTKTISPKGTKEYSYNNLGQLISQKEFSTTDGGSTTNKTISFAYDNKGRVVSKAGISKGKGYSSNISYDPQGRVLSSSESSNGKYFIQKGITYDDKARVISYEKQLYSSGVLTKVQVENIYSTWNGELYQVKDKNSGKVLWELNETNTKGQVLAAKLGAAQITNTYDDNGFLSSVNHSSQVKSGILQLSYSFDAIRNELKSRSTGGDFNINESFDYDDNNRLVNWTDPVTGIKPQPNRNVYDVKGRILENDQIGTIKFQNSAKIYQPTGMTLNAVGTQNYKNDLIQTISYNENNDPVFIDGEKGDVSFQYGLTAMRQQVTYGGNFGSDQEGQFTKFYSEDGSFEVIKNNATGQEKHILYIGGTPYESNIVYLKDFTQSSGSYRFLHKDYIGSILAISDEAGNKLEQRHFDAWGNFTHLQIGNGAIMTDRDAILNAANTLTIDRGYTSHEHFMEVGIIHMNGRLYDPLLRRFLNADENIQDPTNTQNYNKYGYVMNNPLMFNDPSGEYFEAGLFLTILAYAIPAAGIGIGISAAIYITLATINNNFSLGGFARSILVGAATGAISAGIGQVFVAASGFWGAVGVGALSGGATGGVTALITGQNFLEGVLKGAVIGGALSALSWGINEIVNAANVTKGNHEYSKTNSSSYNNMNGSVDQQQYSYGTIKKFEESYGSLGNEGVEHYYLSPPNGYGIAQDGSFYKKTWWDNLWNRNRSVAEGEYLGVASQNNIYLSKAAFASKGLFTEVITHETGHVILTNSNLASLAHTPTNFSKFADKEFLDEWGHVAIRKMSIELQKVNPWMKVEWINTGLRNSEFMRYINASKPELDALLKRLIKPFKY